MLEAIQPSSGGYLEATPLTSFVTLSLASIGLAEHPVAKNGVRFIENSVRPDGNWPIDTNLATWVTTLSVNALATAGELERLDKKPELVAWLLQQQYMVRHPYTGAEPGGWAWTPLPGGVPDMDDTPGALLALERLFRIEHNQSGRASSSLAEIFPGFDPKGCDHPVWNSLLCGTAWLFKLQNQDGGWPTFCRGWGRLPFDRSGCDLTAHALRAFAAWEWILGGLYRAGIKYLARQQRPDGSWLPLWFGNQYAPNDENPTYGTAKVLAAFRDLHLAGIESPYRGIGWVEEQRRGIAWLLSVQNADGGWGGAAATPSSIEETALAVEVLLDAGPEVQAAVNNGLGYLVQQVEAGGLYKPTPIGFYFAKLWYFEKLYPIIFTLAALGRARRKRQPLAV